MYWFFDKYFIAPIINSTGYNAVNTLTYAIILILAIFVVFKILRKLKIEIDGKFALSLLPWILFGSILRVLEDSGYFNTYLLVSPNIYILVFIIAFSTLLFSLFLEKITRITFHSYFFSFGFILAGIFFTQIRLIFFKGVIQILLLDLFFLFLILFFSNFAKFSKPLFNKLTIFSQAYDASSTFVSVQIYGYGEQHVLPNLLVPLFGGNWIFFIIIKLIAALLFVYVVENYVEDKNFKNWLKLVIIILGVAQGTRDMLMLGVFGT